MSRTAKFTLAGQQANRHNALDLEAVPPSLRPLRRWVLWRIEERDGKPTKVPYQPNGQRAKANDPKTWTGLWEAFRALESRRFAGLGFVLGDGITGVDLDWKEWEGDGVPPEALAIVERLASYTEWSPSGKGCHILLKGKLPEGSANQNKGLAPGVHLEAYDGGRFFTFTGKRWEGYPHDLEERQEALEALARELLRREAQEAPPPPRGGPLELTDAELLERMFSSANGPHLRGLWAGEWRALGYPSQSEADLALAGALMFWTGNDFARADRLFRQSGLYRPKWDKRHSADGRTYGQLTLERAVAANPYEPGPRGVRVREASPTPPATRGDEAEWPAPRPLGELEAPLPPWHLGVLPQELDDLALAIGEKLAVEPTAPALAMLGAVSGVLANRGVFISPNGVGWEEPTALWVVLIGPPGVGKTPILRRAADPLWDLEEELQEENREARRAYEADLAAWQKAKKGEGGEKPEPPAERRLVTADSTPEKLELLLKDNPGLIVVRDEIKGLLASWKKESMTPARAFFLAAYHASSHVVDRIGRGTTLLKRPALALLGALQTGPWTGIVQEAGRLDNEADGLLQRLTPVLVEPTPPVRRPPDVPPPLLAHYRALVRGIWESARAGTLRLSQEAKETWADWYYETQLEARNPEHPEAWRSYLGKRPSLTLRLAGVLAAIWGEPEVSDRTLKAAIFLVKGILEPHARRAWKVGEVGDLSHAIRLARKLKEEAGKLKEFTRRDVYSKKWGGITTSEEAGQALRALEAAGWVSYDPRARLYRLNPRIREVQDVCPPPCGKPSPQGGGP